MKMYRKRRNAHAYAARARRAGPHGGSRRPQPKGSPEPVLRTCPGCLGSGLGLDSEYDAPYICFACGGARWVEDYDE